MDNIVERIKCFNKGRLEEMLQFKYQVMTENIFRFYRATNHLFYEDLSGMHSFPTSPSSWICGDLHLENYGSYKGDNRLVYFDLNDFDDALLAPVSHELVRIVCSILIAFDSLKIEEQKALKMGRLFVKEYATVLTQGKARYIEPQTAMGIVRTFLKAVSKRKQRKILEKRTVKNKNSLRLLMKHPRHFEIEKYLKEELYQHITEWIRSNSDGPYNYEVIDAAFRLAGTSSLGLKRFIFLLRSTNRKDKYILMEMKQAVAPTLQKFIDMQQPKWETEAQRIMSVQQRMQNVPPALLSHTIFKNESFIIQEMQPTRDSFNFKQIRDQYRDIYQVIHDMATLTASSQIRSSGWKSSAVVDTLSEFGENDQWQDSILDYARNYSVQVKNNYREYCLAYKSGAFK